MRISTCVVLALFTLSLPAAFGQKVNKDQPFQTKRGGTGTTSTAVNAPGSAGAGKIDYTSPKGGTVQGGGAANTESGAKGGGLVITAPNGTKIQGVGAIGPKGVPVGGIRVTNSEGASAVAGGIPGVGAASTVKTSEGRTTKAVTPDGGKLVSSTTKDASGNYTQTRHITTTDGQSYQTKAVFNPQTGEWSYLVIDGQGNVIQQDGGNVFQEAQSVEAVPAPDAGSDAKVDSNL